MSRTSRASVVPRRRWNTAFRDLAHQFLFRPLAPRIGSWQALWVSFLASGLIHDAVISIPARGGYGKPTLFFLIQAAALCMERLPAARKLGLGNGAAGWMFTAAMLILPAPLLFHTTFLHNVIIPFIEAVGAA